MFSIEVLQRQFDLQTPEGKTAFYREAARRLTEFEEELERNNYIEAVAQEYQIDVKSLKELVRKTAVQDGLAKPAARPRSVAAREHPREDGTLKSQKILLTWLIDRPKLFEQVQKYITPQDFTEEMYRTVASLLYEQYGQGEVNPAKIINHFTEEKEHCEVASLFHTKIQELTTLESQQKALQDTIIKVKTASLEKAARELLPTDMAGLKKLMEDRRSLEELRKLHISIE